VKQGPSLAQFFVRFGCTFFNTADSPDVIRPGFEGGSLLAFPDV